MNEALEITKKGPKPRPLSPHLQIYKWQLTSLMSIGHRASGIALSLGSILIVTWLVTLASGPELFSIASLVISHWFGQFILFGFSVVLFYHLLNGIRHLSWDIGYGFNLSIVYKTGYAVLFTALFLTIVTWLTVWFGLNHWITQRVTAIALVPLTIWFVSILAMMKDSSYQSSLNLVSNPFNATILILLILSMFWHAQLGLQVVFEDYISNKNTRMFCIITMKFFMTVIGLLSALSVLRIAL